MLDLHRMAALFIVERMRSEIVATVCFKFADHTVSTFQARSSRVDTLEFLPVSLQC